MCGERITQNRLIRVGNGTGPPAAAPVRSAASTICADDLVNQFVVERGADDAHLLPGPPAVGRLAPANCLFHHDP